MMDNDTIFDNVKEWDFEKYATVILYVNTYYEKCMSRSEKIYAMGEQQEYCKIPVTKELLHKLEIEETLEEFFGEAQVMQEDMILDDESTPLFKVTEESNGLTLFVDTIIFKSMTDWDNLEEEEKQELTHLL